MDAPAQGRRRIVSGLAWGRATDPLPGVLIIALLTMSSCVTPPPAPPQAAAPAPTDRLTNFRRLALAAGAPPPDIATSGTTQVLDLAFDAGVFFDTNSDIPRPEAAHLLDTLAAEIRGDRPDTAVTVLGHTDSVGSDAFNIDLSRRRAERVIADLEARGVRPAQLSAVAIGKRQPVASNATEAGRARNRRVEFLISDSLAANLDVVAQRPATSARVQVLRPRAEDGQLAPVAELSLPELPPPAATAAPAPVLNTPAPRPAYRLNTPQRYQTNTPGPAQVY